MKQTLLIKGIGNDIIEIDRIRKTIDKYGHQFYNKILTGGELEYCLSHKNPAPSIASRFSVKEAIAKALGTGFGKKVSFLDIEILHDELGRPFPEFTDSLNNYFNTPHLLISMSHCKEYATAVAIWLED